MRGIKNGHPATFFRNEHPCSQQEFQKFLEKRFCGNLFVCRLWLMSFFADSYSENQGLLTALYHNLYDELGWKPGAYPHVYYKRILCKALDVYIPEGVEESSFLFQKKFSSGNELLEYVRHSSEIRSLQIDEMMSFGELLGYFFFLEGTIPFEFCMIRTMIQKFWPDLEKENFQYLTDHMVHDVNLHLPELKAALLRFLEVHPELQDAFSRGVKDSLAEKVALYSEAFPDVSFSHLNS